MLQPGPGFSKAQISRRNGPSGNRLPPVVAGILGFTGISAASADIARFLFYVFVVIFLVLLILGLTIFRA